MKMFLTCADKVGYVRAKKYGHPHRRRFSTADEARSMMWKWESTFQGRILYFEVCTACEGFHVFSKKDPRV